MNGTWVKFFVNGTQERGSDADIAKNKASWSKGRLDGIVEVSISEGFSSCRLTLRDAEWHQFDRLAAPVSVGSHASVRTHRVVQAKIEEKHVGKLIETKYINSMAICRLVDAKTRFTTGKKIEKEDVGMWLSAILPARDKPYFVISERGKIKEKDSK